MKNYYSTIDKVVLTFSDVKKDSDGFEYLETYFEKPCDGGFHYSKWMLPDFKCTNSFGFSEDDIMNQENYLRNNLLLLWEIAKENGEKQSA